MIVQPDYLTVRPNWRQLRAAQRSGVTIMSALAPKADIVERDRHVSFVPIGDQRHRNKIKVIVASVRRTDKTDRLISSVGGTPFKTTEAVTMVFTRRDFLHLTLAA